MLPQDSFRLFQPAVGIVSDRVFGVIETCVVPDAATFMLDVQPLCDFRSEYLAAVSDMKTPAHSLENAIGADAYAEWKAYLDAVPPPPGGDTAALFFEWAMVHAPDVAAAGAAELASQSRAAPRPPNSTTLHATLRDAQDFLARSPSLQIEWQVSEKLDHAPMLLRVATTPGVAEELSPYGVWRGTDPRRVSERFAAGRVSVSVAVAAAATWPVSRGEWYDSSLLHRAYGNQSGPRWDHFFGPSGTLRRAMTSIALGDSIQVTVKSDAMYSEADQRLLQTHAASGLWPLYLGSSADITNAVAFDEDNRLTMTITTPAGTPIALGATVLDMAIYLGHGAPAGASETASR